MGNTCTNIKSLSIIKSNNKNDLPITAKLTIRLLLIGLDNAGKTSTALHLLKKPLIDVIPTLGFQSYTLNTPALSKKDTKVELIDLGGSIKIRKLWSDYFPRAHGLILLLDSADSERFKELKSELETIVSNTNVKGKPILVLLNKMDLDDAMDEIEILNEINIEQLVNDNKCPTKIEQCAVLNKNKPSNEKKPNLDNSIEQGFDWIINYILNNWDKLDDRVRIEMLKEEKANKEKMNALREKYKNKDDNQNEDDNQLKEGDKKENPFKSINDVVKELEKKERINGLDKNKKKEPIKNEVKEEKKKTKSKPMEKLADRLNEVKKKAMVLRQNKVDEEPKNDKTQLLNEKNASINEQDELVIKEIDKDNDLKKENLNEINLNSTTTNSLVNSVDTISNETVIEVKK